MIEGKKVVATIEGRMTSSRLPGKIMMPLAGRPVMAHMIERHRRSKLTDEVVVATTTNVGDDVVAALCEKMGCAYFRGSEEDCLGRIVGAGEQNKADILVQGFADSPLFDWRYVDRCVTLLAEHDADCASNEFTKTFPIGLGVRAYKFKTLKDAEKNDTELPYREHAGYSIRVHPDRFKHAGWEAEGDMKWPELRLTLDTREDYTLVSAVYDELYPKNPDFSAEDVVAFLKTQPDIAATNSEIKQKIPTL